MQKLYIKQKVFKITDHYPILDEEENTLYFVDQDFTLIGKTVHVSDRDENEIFVINKKILTWLPEYHISYANGQEVIIKSNFTFFKDSMNIISQDYDLSVKGDFLVTIIKYIRMRTLQQKLIRYGFLLGILLNSLFMTKNLQTLLLAFA
ncbi:LURP-one-related family protein [uncultured Peptoniphilus sp.]|uniref:LURP-one-related/scramblase family protein n=1 Tax=uncultured Peptoniphilus sp. TaxID=254354 RepID=UPI002803A956|nr:LURP-one-related family protein [uncultured Peptoniphilus sp.]